MTRERREQLRPDLDGNPADRAEGGLDGGPPPLEPPGSGPSVGVAADELVISHFPSIFCTS